MNNSNDKLAYSLKAACALLDGMGWNESKIIKFVKRAHETAPTPGYIYMDGMVGGSI